MAETTIDIGSVLHNFQFAGQEHQSDLAAFGILGLESRNVAIIDGNIATFKPEDSERCEITLVFLPGKLKVMQDGSDVDCGFGHNVNATGTYTKIRGGKPKFEPPV